MTRSIYKGPFSELKKDSIGLSSGRLNPLETRNQKEGKVTKRGGNSTHVVFQDGRYRLWSRRSLILPENVGLDCEIHNGKRFVPFKVREEMVGHKFGEFALTRKRPQHKSSKKKRR